MAQVANTYDTFDSKRGREQLSDVIDMITPDETPFYSMIPTIQLEGVHPEWNTDTLATPSTTNKRVQGDTYSYNQVDPTARIGNYTQISMKEFIIAETEEKVSKAGPRSDFDREMMKKGIDLRCDMEVQMLSNSPSIAGAAAGATAAQSAGARAWIATNDLLGGSGASGGFNSGTSVVDIATNGTQRAFTKALMDAGISAAYVAGGNPTVLMMSPYVKTIFSTFMADANVVPLRLPLTGRNQATIIAAADTYVSDFGQVTVVPNRQMARAGATVARNVYGFDKTKWALGILRPIQRDNNAAKTGDALPGVLKVEYALISKNEAANFVVADVFGMTAST
jgi:hypothetical protein